MSAISLRWPRILEVIAVGAVFFTILVEWAGYTVHVARLSYVLLVPVLVAVLAIVPSSESRDAGVSPDRLDRGIATGLLLASAFLLAMGSLASIFTLSIAAFPVAVLALAVSWRGRGILRRRPWAAILAFAIVPPPSPLFDRVNPPLTEATGRVAVALVRPFDGDASWSVPDLHFRGWTLEVAQACSGSGTLLVFLVLGLFLAGLFRLRVLPAGLLLVACVPFALVVNGLRIGGTALLLDRFGPEAGQGFAHELVGQGVVIGGAALMAWGVYRYARFRARRAS